MSKIENFSKIDGTVTLSVKDFSSIESIIYEKNKKIEELEDKLKKHNIMKSTNCKELENFRTKINYIQDILSNTKETKGVFSNIKSGNSIIIDKIKIIVNE